MTAKSDISGHTKTHDVLERIHPEVIELVRLGTRTSNQSEAKEMGLPLLRYSLALESSTHPNYLAGNFHDCRVAFTPPVYSCHQSVFYCFQTKFLIWLKPDAFEENLAILRSALMEVEKPVHPLEEARRPILTECSLQGILLHMLKGIPAVYESAKIRLTTFGSFLQAEIVDFYRITYLFERGAFQ